MSIFHLHARGSYHMLVPHALYLLTGYLVMS